jgi:mannose-6-phosphate isomerase-like protein (cupin superfamily)
MRIEDGGILVGPADGKDLTNPIGGGMVVKVRDADTAGAYSVHDNTIPPGSPGPRPHFHHRHEEAFHVSEGELAVRVGPRKIVAPPGSFVVVPRGMVHQPSNPGPLPTRVLLVFSRGDGPVLRGGSRGAHAAGCGAERSGGPGEARGLDREVRLRVRGVAGGDVMKALHSRRTS